MEVSMLHSTCNWGVFACFSSAVGFSLDSRQVNRNSQDAPVRVYTENVAFAVLAEGNHLKLLLVEYCHILMD